MISIILSILAIVACGFIAFMMFKFRKTVLENTRSDVYMRVNEEEVYHIEKKIKNLESQIYGLSKDNEELLRKIQKLNTQVKVIDSQPKAKDSQFNPNNNVEKNIKNPTKPAVKYQDERDARFSYVSSLYINDAGELTIPLWSIDSSNTNALFRLRTNLNTGDTFYELNPNVQDIQSHIDTLKDFAVMRGQINPSALRTIEPGRLIRKGQEFKVASKLKIG